MKKRICQSNDVQVFQSPVINDTILIQYPDNDTYHFCWTDLDAFKKNKCVFEGNVYKIGEKITPEGTCVECICDEHLKTQDLDIYTPQCQRKQCSIGVSGEQHDYLNRGCVPVYDRTATLW